MLINYLGYLYSELNNSCIVILIFISLILLLFFLFTPFFLISSVRSKYEDCFDNKYYVKNMKISRASIIISCLIKKVNTKYKTIAEKERNIINSLTFANDIKDKLFRTNNIFHESYKKIFFPIKAVLLILFIPIMIIWLVVIIYVSPSLHSGSNSSYNLTYNTFYVVVFISFIILFINFYIGKYFKDKLPYEWRIDGALLSILRDYYERKDIYKIISTRVIEYKFKYIKNMLEKQSIFEGFSNMHNYSRADYLYLEVCKFIDSNNFVEVSGKEYYNFMCDLLKGLVLNASQMKLKSISTYEAISRKNSFGRSGKYFITQTALILALLIIFLCLLATLFYVFNVKNFPIPNVENMGVFRGIIFFIERVGTITGAVIALINLFNEIKKLKNNIQLGLLPFWLTHFFRTICFTKINYIIFLRC
jgi:hypothetical protein